MAPRDIAEARSGEGVPSRLVRDLRKLVKTYLDDHGVRLVEKDLNVEPISIPGDVFIALEYTEADLAQLKDKEKADHAAAVAGVSMLIDLGARRVGRALVKNGRRWDQAKKVRRELRKDLDSVKQTLQDAEEQLISAEAVLEAHMSATRGMQSQVEQTKVYKTQRRNAERAAKELRKVHSKFDLKFLDADAHAHDLKLNDTALQGAQAAIEDLATGWTKLERKWPSKS